MAFSEHCPSLHFTSCYNLLNFLQSIFTSTWVFFAVVDLRVWCFGPVLTPLCCPSGRSSLASGRISWWHLLLVSVGDTFHVGAWSSTPFFSSSSSSQSVFCCLRHYCSSSSQGAIFLMYLWMLLVSSWIMALRRTNPHPPSFHYLYSLRVYVPICMYIWFFPLYTIYILNEKVCADSQLVLKGFKKKKFWHKPLINYSHFYPCPLFSDAIYSL